MKEIEFVTLEDNIEYIIVDKIDNYVYLAKENEKEFFDIKKFEFENNEEYFSNLDNKEEFDKALYLFTNKHKNIV